MKPRFFYTTQIKGSMEIKSRLRENYQLSDTSLQLILEKMERITYLKKEIVVREGERDHYIYFVEQGSIRGYSFRNGKQVTLSFAFEGDMAATVPGYSNNTISKRTLETLENSVLMKIPRKEMALLFSHSIELANWGRLLVEKNLLEYEHYFLDYFWTDKKTQYLKFIKEYPQLLQRVSLKEIASYLNITPQTLSRIRAHIS